MRTNIEQKELAKTPRNKMETKNDEAARSKALNAEKKYHGKDDSDGAQKHTEEDESTVPSEGHDELSPSILPRNMFRWLQRYRALQDVPPPAFQDANTINDESFVPLSLSQHKIIVNGVAFARLLRSFALSKGQQPPDVDVFVAGEDNVPRQARGGKLSLASTRAAHASNWSILAPVLKSKYRVEISNSQRAHLASGSMKDIGGSTQHSSFALCLKLLQKLKKELKLLFPPKNKKYKSRKDGKCVNKAEEVALAQTAANKSKQDTTGRKANARKKTSKPTRAIQRPTKKSKAAVRSNDPAGAARRGVSHRNSPSTQQRKPSPAIAMKIAPERLALFTRENHLPLQEAQTVLEYLVLALSRSLGAHPHQALHLLTALCDPPHSEGKTHIKKDQLRLHMVHGLRGGRFDQILRWVRQLNCDCAFIALLAIEVGDANTEAEYSEDHSEENSETNSASPSDTWWRVWWPLLLHILEAGIVSDNAELANVCCRTIASLSKHFRLALRARECKPTRPRGSLWRWLVSTRNLSPLFRGGSALRHHLCSPTGLAKIFDMLKRAPNLMQAAAVIVMEAVTDPGVESVVANGSAEESYRPSLLQKLFQTHFPTEIQNTPGVTGSSGMAETFLIISYLLPPLTSVDPKFRQWLVARPTPLHHLMRAAVDAAEREMVPQGGIFRASRDEDANARQVAAILVVNGFRFMTQLWICLPEVVRKFPHGPRTIASLLKKALVGPDSGGAERGDQPDAVVFHVQTAAALALLDLVAGFTVGHPLGAYLLKTALFSLVECYHQQVRAARHGGVNQRSPPHRCVFGVASPFHAPP